MLTDSNHPVSVFSKIHSSTEKDYKSVNAVTFQAMEQGAALFGKAAFGMATFGMDRGYDDNKIFLKLDELGQDYVIRLKSNRKLLYHNKWTMATELRNRRKGKVKTNVIYRRNFHFWFLKKSEDWYFEQAYPVFNYNLRKFKVCSLRQYVTTSHL